VLWELRGVAMGGWSLNLMRGNYTSHLPSFWGTTGLKPKFPSLKVASSSVATSVGGIKE